MKKRVRKDPGLKSLVCALAAALILSAVDPAAAFAASNEAVATEEMSDSANDTADDSSSDGSLPQAPAVLGAERRQEAEEPAARTGQVLGAGRVIPQPGEDDLNAAACLLGALSILAIIALGWAQKKDEHKEEKNI